MSMTECVCHSLYISLCQLHQIGYCMLFSHLPASLSVYFVSILINQYFYELHILNLYDECMGDIAVWWWLYTYPYPYPYLLIAFDDDIGLYGVGNTLYECSDFLHCAICDNLPLS